MDMGVVLARRRDVVATDGVSEAQAEHLGIEGHGFAGVAAAVGHVMEFSAQHARPVPRICPRRTRCDDLGLASSANVVSVGGSLVWSNTCSTTATSATEAGFAGPARVAVRVVGRRWV